MLREVKDKSVKELHVKIYNQKHHHPQCLYTHLDLPSKRKK